MLQPLESLGRADIGRAGVAAVGRVIGERPIDVLAGVEVGVSVAVEVGPADGGGPRHALVDARRGGHVGELPAALPVRFVVEEGQATPPTDEQIGPAVAVVIGHGGAVGVEPRLATGERGQPHLLRDVFELEAALVAVKFGRGAEDFLVVLAAEYSAAGEEEIEQAIAVEVDNGETSAERFEDREGRGGADFAVLVFEVDAGLRGNILEDRGASSFAGVLRQHGCRVRSRPGDGLVATEEDRRRGEQQGDCRDDDYAAEHGRSSRKRMRTGGVSLAFGEPTVSSVREL